MNALTSCNCPISFCATNLALVASKNPCISFPFTVPLEFNILLILLCTSACSLKKLEIAFPNSKDIYSPVIMSFS